MDSAHSSMETRGHAGEPGLATVNGISPRRDKELKERLALKPTLAAAAWAEGCPLQFMNGLSALSVMVRPGILLNSAQLLHRHNAPGRTGVSGTRPRTADRAD